jgi:hypothetical protein
MSDALYPTRLRWHHTTGVARHDGVSVFLDRAPVLEGMECMTELDFIPQIIQQVRIGCQPTRDMGPAECARAMGLLIAMSTAARLALQRTGAG